MVVDQSRSIHPGWKVRGSDGAEIGTIEEVREDHLVVRGGTLFKHDLYVPITACAAIGRESVTLRVAGSDVDAEGWRFPPQRGFGRGEGRIEPSGERGMTTMTGAGFGAGGGVSAAGPLAPGHGDAIVDRLGGSGRAGLSATSERSADELEAIGDVTAAEDDVEGVEDEMEGEDTDDDTSGDTSGDTSTDTSGDARPVADDAGTMRGEDEMTGSRPV